MIRSFLKIAKRGPYLPIYQHQPSLTFLRKSYFASEPEINRYSELKHLSKILGTPYFRHNDELNMSGDVRLLDNGNKLIGIYNLSDAKKKCQMLKLDMVLTNATSRPPICKAYNYREDLYKKFVKEVVEKDIPKLNKARQRTGQTKTVKLGPKMTNSDLNTKIELAKEMAKRVKTVRVFMRVNEETEESGRNIIFTFRDLAREFLKPRGDIEEREVYEDEEELYKEGKKNETEDEGDEKALVQEFQSLLNDGPGDMRAMTEQEIKEMIQTYIQREVRKKTLEDEIDFLVKTNDKDVKAVKDLEENDDDDDEDLSFLNLKRNVENIDTEEEAKEDPGFVSMMEDIEEEDETGRTTKQLNEEIEELKTRFGGNRNEAIAEFILTEQEKKMHVAKRLARFKTLYEKRKGI